MFGGKPDVYEGAPFRPMQGIPENGKFLQIKSGIQLEESGSHKRLESRIQIPLTNSSEFNSWNLESTAWNPESKTVLDSLIGRNSRCLYQAVILCDNAKKLNGQSNVV